MRHVVGFVVVLFGLSFGSLRATAEEAEAVDLLRVSGVAVEESAASGRDAAVTAAMTDDDDSTVATIEGADDGPVSVVYRLSDAVVSPERLVVKVPAKSETVSPPVRVELLVSTVSGHAGFQAVRSDRLTDESAPQEYRFIPTAARWVMLRFTPAVGTKKVSVAEVELFGHQGPPVTRYKFKEAPAKAFDVLKRLEKTSSLGISISPDEASLFEDARDGKLDQWSFAEAALLASGAQDAKARQKYLKQLDEMEKEARKATDSADRPFAKGAALLAYLHNGPMSKGYESVQTDLSVLLDKQTFNCVSSATIFKILARRLGLDARAIEVPNHAFSIVYDGTDHADVETTTAGGFNPERDDAALAEFTKLTGFAYIPDSNRDERREVGEVGLTAIICYNHAVGLASEKRYHESLVANFRAMSLDPEFDSAVKNALAVLANWGYELAGEKKFEEALNVVGTGLDLAPEDATLVNNRKAVWSQWADSLMQAGNDDEALAVLRRAAQAVPDGDFQKVESWVFIRKGEEHVKDGKWDEALAVVEPGLQKLDGQPRKDLEEWGNSLFIRWSYDEIKAGRFDKALEVLERGLAAKPDSSDYIEQMAYAVQESSWAEYQKQGAEKSFAAVAELARRFGKYESVAKVAKNHAHRVVQDLMEQKKFDEARTAATLAGKTLNDEPLATELIESAVDGRARTHLDQKEWQAAIDLYVAALAELPNNEHLQNNLKAAWSQWASVYSDERDWAKAIEVNEKAFKQAADRNSVTNNIPYYVQEWAKDVFAKEGAEASGKILVEQIKKFAEMKEVAEVGRGHVQRVVDELCSSEKYDDALDAADRLAKQLNDEEAGDEAVARVYDTWAEKFRDEKEWQSAVDVYAKGVKRYPKNEHIAQNASAIWDRWARIYEDERDWSGAIGVNEKAFKEAADPKKASNNIPYYVQEWSKDVYARDGVEASGKVLVEQIKRFPDMKELGDVARNHVLRVADDLATKEKYDDAVDAADRLGKQLENVEAGDDAAGAVYDTWAGKLIEKQEWQSAVDVYAKGRKRYPKNRHIEDNMASTWDQWAKTYIETKDWAAAIKVYEEGRKVLPDNSLLKNNLEYCQEKLKEEGK